MIVWIAMYLCKSHAKMQFPMPKCSLIIGKFVQNLSLQKNKVLDDSKLASNSASYQAKCQHGRKPPDQQQWSTTCLWSSYGKAHLARKGLLCSIADNNNKNPTSYWYETLKRLSWSYMLRHEKKIRSSPLHRLCKGPSKIMETYLNRYYWQIKYVNLCF